VDCDEFQIIAFAATLASIYEVTARKPGNVHPGASFDDVTTYAAFVKSALIAGPIVGRARDVGVGQTVLKAVAATRAAVGTNTNLGTVLLLAPLAAVPLGHGLEGGIARVLDELTADDTRAVYEAIRQSGAGGLGRVAQADVIADRAPRLTLVEAMRLAADRDLVARQYTNRFADVFAVAGRIVGNLSLRRGLENAIVEAYVHQLAQQADSLVARKCGLKVAQECSARAARVLQAGSPGEAAYESALAELDLWLRADGHRRNPGTTADLVAAGLFVLLRESRLDWHVS
jgi:triphosphoribosyl-dephospho-CoA synthase